MIVWSRALLRRLRHALLATPLMLIPMAAHAGSVGVEAQPGTAMNLQGFSDLDPRRFGVGERCTAIDADGRDPGRPLQFGAAGCGRSIPAAPKELAVQRGEVSLKLAIIGGDERNGGTLRSALSIDHALALGPITGWQLHADAFAERLESGSGDPIQEQVRLSLARGLPAGWKLLVTCESTARGALDPSGAIAQASELAALLSRSFRLSEFGSEHLVNVKAAEQRDVDHLYGTDQRKLLAGVTYAHTLEFGSLAADAAYVRSETVGTGEQSTARLQVKYSGRF